MARKFYYNRLIESVILDFAMLSVFHSFSKYRLWYTGVKCSPITPILTLAVRFDLIDWSTFPSVLSEYGGDRAGVSKCFTTSWNTVAESKASCGLGQLGEKVLLYSEVFHGHVARRQRKEKLLSHCVYYSVIPKQFIQLLLLYL